MDDTVSYDRQMRTEETVKEFSMKPQDIATAITQALVQGGAQWMVSTIVAFLPVLWTMTLIMHLGRPYVLRTLRRCGLRLGADVWWMSYLLMRDAVLVVTFALSFIFFQPSIVANDALPITGPLAALCLLLALAVPLRLAVEGTCPPAPQRCTSGAELQLSNQELVALTIAVTFGLLALFIGYFGLSALYRMRPSGAGADAASQPVWPAEEPAGWRRRAAKEEATELPAEEPAKPAEEPPPTG